MLDRRLIFIQKHNLNLNSQNILLTLSPERFLNVNALSKVDFPAPDAPMIANN